MVIMLVTASLLASEPVITKDASIMPQSFEFEGAKYNVSTDFNPEPNMTIKHDLDNDGQAETIVGFQSRNTDGEIPVSFMAIGKEKNDTLDLEYIIPGNDYFDKIELKDMDSDGLYEIIFWQSGGAHYTNLDILKYRKGKMERLFSDGSACAVYIEGDSYPYKIKVGREKWDDKDWCYAAGTDSFEAYTWNGTRFSYNTKLSTSRLIGEKGADDLYVKEIMKTMKNLKENK